MTDAALAAPGRASARRGPGRLGAPARVSLALLGLLAVAILGAGLLAPHDPLTGQLADRLQPPSATYPLGTDAQGRCLLSRLLAALQVTPVAALALVAVAATAGTSVGLLSGMAGGAVDRCVMRLVEGILVFPSLGAALLLVAALGVSLWGMVAALAATHWADYARLARNVTVAERAKTHVLAARALGVGPGGIARRHVLPGLRSPLVVMVTFSLSWAVLSFTGLSFLGLGAAPGTPELGLMIAEARSHMRSYPRLILVPGVTLVVMLVALNVLGDAFRDRRRGPAPGRAWRDRFLPRSNEARETPR